MGIGTGKIGVEYLYIMGIPVGLLKFLSQSSKSTLVYRQRRLMDSKFLVSSSSEVSRVKSSEFKPVFLFTEISCMG